MILRFLLKSATMFACYIALIFSSPAYAWDGVVRFSIGEIHAASGTNSAFRVYGPGAMCGANTPYWVFMNVDWDNYQATAALLTSAFMSNKEVTVYSTKDSNGYCVIGYVMIHK